VRCRESLHKLLEKAGLPRQPRLSACGGRGNTFEDFQTAHGRRQPGDYIAMLVDSEEPVADAEEPWAHLKARDGWDRPEGASEDQVLLMTTCMETWIVADRTSLREHYGVKLQESALPPLHDLEVRARQDVQDRLSHATRDCKNAYAKGPRSFEIVAELQPAALQNLPSFARAIRILRERV
jgi:hypothetical protein